MYGNSNGNDNGQGSSSSYHQQQQQTYPFAGYDYGLPSSAGPGPGPGPSSASYEYSYSRSDPMGSGQGQAPIPVNVETVDHAFQDSSGAWQDQWSQPGPQQQQQQQQQYDATTYGYGNDWSRQGGEGVGKSQWPATDEYVEPSGAERELSGLRMTLSDLVESIRPYASSPTNPRPPPPPAHLQAHFLRLASTVQTSLTNIQPHIHPFLHPSFTLPLPPHDHSRHDSGSGAGSRSRTPLTAAEKEMEVIRKRRDMLIARAAQVQASSHPAAVAVHNNQLPMGMGWNNNAHGHGELYQSLPQQQQHLQNPFDNSNGLPTGFNSSSRRSTMTLDNFDASLARFSLDPSKAVGGNDQTIGNNSPRKAAATGGASAEESGRCHGCGVSVTAEWRRGPDGPRSLCNACGLHYAKLARRRAQEEQANGNGNGHQMEQLTMTAPFATNALA